MIQRKTKEEEPFSKVKIEKLAYDLSDVEPENYRKQIKAYITSLYPFLSSGLQNVNYKKQPDEEGNAIGTIAYENNGISLTIPIIIDEYNLKEPTVAIYNGNIVPLDKEYLDYVVDDPEYGEQVSENELPANMQYLTQSGLFQDSDSGMYKGSSILSTVFEEDEDNPYHYRGSILKRASDNTISIDQDIYCGASDMLKMIKEAESNRDKYVHACMSSNEKVASAPVVQKITDSGTYKSVMLDGKVQACTVLSDLFNIEGGSTKSLAIEDKDGNGNISAPMGFGQEAISQSPKWGYGDAYGAGYFSDSCYIGDYGKLTPDECTMRNIMFERSTSEKHSNYSNEKKEYSAPYYVDMVENVSYGDGEQAKILFVRAMDSNKDSNGTKLRFLISDKTAEIKKIDKDKLKNSELRYLYNDNEDIYVVPATYNILDIGNNRVSLDGYKDGYTNMIHDLAEKYPNKMTVINKGANLYTINVDSDNASQKYANINGDSALLLANYYTGNAHNSMREYQPDMAYLFDGDITKKAIDRSAITPLSRHKGEYRKFASYLRSLDEETQKVAEIETIADSLVGTDAVIDDEHIDTTNIMETIDSVIRKVGELILMARLGKNDLSESILSRAIYALVKLSNELRGMANANAQ